jgi:hypothetical protein
MRRIYVFFCFIKTVFSDNINLSRFNSIRAAQRWQRYKPRASCNNTQLSIVCWPSVEWRSLLLTVSPSDTRSGWSCWFSCVTHLVSSVVYLEKTVFNVLFCITEENRRTCLFLFRLQELYNVFSSPNITVRLFTSRRMRWAGYVVWIK